MSPWRTRMKLPGTVPPKVQNVYVTPSAISLVDFDHFELDDDLGRLLAIGRRWNLRRTGQHRVHRLALRRTEVALQRAAGGGQPVCVVAACSDSPHAASSATVNSIAIVFFVMAHPRR